NQNIFICLDSTQYVAHHKLDLNNSQIDFAVGSAHKMLGPSGIGFLYINKKLIENIKPTIMGGGMNFEIRKSFYTLMSDISKFEAGTPNIMGIYGWNKALDWYLENDLQKESLRIYQLKNILEKELSEIKDIKILNPKINSFILLFTYNNIFSQDIASYLGNNGVIVRSGLSCAKLADEIINIPHAVRVSLHFYTNESDILKLIDLLKKYKRGDELDGII
nr:aminotransferase class V-fold PLP-dependent enzyme [Malacoplasma sp.]